MTATPNETRWTANLVWSLVVGVTGVAFVAMLIGVGAIAGTRGFQFEPGTWLVQTLFFGTPYFACAAALCLTRHTRSFRWILGGIALLLMLSTLPTVYVAVSTVRRYLDEGTPYGIAVHGMLAVFIALFQYPLAVISIVLGLVDRWTCTKDVLEPEDPAW